jgi:uncharacterized delta-60 repeat protein
MALTSSGEISLGDLQGEFGGTNPIGISEYYRGEGLVPNQPPNFNIPITGTLKLSDFYSTSFIESAYLINLGYDISSNSLACADFNSSPSSFYIDSTNITTAFILATNSTLNSFAPAGWYSDGNVARYWSGTLFQNFIVPCGTTNFYSNLSSEINGEIRALAIEESSNSIIVGGKFEQTYGFPENIKALNFDGSDNVSFNNNLGTGLYGWFTDLSGGVTTSFGFPYVLAIKVDTNNRILVGGEFRRLNGKFRNGMVRLNPDGTEDTTFYTDYLGDSGFNSYVGSIEIENDGRILVGGQFTTAAGYFVPYLCRLNANSVDSDLIDTSFNTNLGSGPNNRVNSIKKLSNGQILIGGVFTQFNGTSKNGLVRLNSNGTVDTTFDIGTGFSNGGSQFFVNSIEEIYNGQILVGGSFTNYNGTTVSNLVLLDTDGTLETSTTTMSLSLNGVVLDMNKLGDGSIVVGGSFTSPSNNRNENGIKKFKPDDSIQGVVLGVDREFRRNIGTGATGAGIYTNIEAIVEKPNGSLVIGGNFTTFNDEARIDITELNSKGGEFVTTDFDSNGGTPTFPNQRGLSPLYVTNPGTPTRSGFTFSGWRPTVENVIDYQHSVPTAINTSTTFIAIWKGEITISIEESIEAQSNTLIIQTIDETNDNNIHEFVLEVSISGGSYNVAESKLNSSIYTNPFNFEYNAEMSTNYSFRVKSLDITGTVLKTSNIASITTTTLVLTSMSIIQDSSASTPILACEGGTTLGNLFYYYAPTTTSLPSSLGTKIYVDSSAQDIFQGGGNWYKFYKDNIYFTLEVGNDGITLGYDECS